MELYLFAFALIIDSGILNNLAISEILAFLNSVNSNSLGLSEILSYSKPSSNRTVLPALLTPEYKFSQSALILSITSGLNCVSDFKTANGNDPFFKIDDEKSIPSNADESTLYPSFKIPRGLKPSSVSFKIVATSIVFIVLSG